MDKELKACPFCGGAARLDQRVTQSLWNSSDAVFSHVACDECDIHGQDFCDDPDGSEAIEWWNARAQAGQGGEAVEVFAYGSSEGYQPVFPRQIIGSNGERISCYDIPLMTVAQHQRILAAATRPADQVADDLTMVKVSRELLQDLRDLAFDQVEHHRAAMGAYKQTRQSAMDSVIRDADALLRS